MPRAAACLVPGVMLALGAGPALATAGSEPAAEAVPAPAPASAPAPAREKRADPDRVEGAVGLVLSHRPSYPGSSTLAWNATPAGFLRWGRISITGAGGFTTRRRDEVERGLGADLVRRDGLRLSANLRYDSGRDESASPDLAGLGEIRRTLRGRLSLRWQVDEHWRLSLGAGTDLLNRVGGSVFDLSVARQWPLPGDSLFQLDIGASAGTDRYQQAWFGITPQQAARSGYPVFQVPEGVSLRDVHVNGTLRTDFGPRWSGFATLGWSRALGPAADSPLTRRISGASFSSGLAWRF